jgi:hypothetical protein
MWMPGAQHQTLWFKPRVGACQATAGRFNALPYTRGVEIPESRVSVQRATNAAIDGSDCEILFPPLQHRHAIHLCVYSGFGLTAGQMTAAHRITRTLRITAARTVRRASPSQLPSQRMLGRHHRNPLRVSAQFSSATVGSTSTSPPTYTVG